MTVRSGQMSIVATQYHGVVNTAKLGHVHDLIKNEILAEKGVVVVTWVSLNPVRWHFPTK